MNIQVLEKLGMCGDGKKVFVLGTSQGGWITVRMALIAPDRVSRPPYFWFPASLAYTSQILTARFAMTDIRYYSARHINGLRKRTHSQARMLGCANRPDAYD